MSSFIEQKETTTSTRKGKAKEAYIKTASIGTSFLYPDSVSRNTSVITDESTSVLYHATAILDRLIADKTTIATLQPYDKKALFYYFKKTKRVVARALELKTSIPLSKGMVNKVHTSHRMCDDYISRFTNRILTDIKFNDAIIKVVKDAYMYESAYLIVYDDGFKGMKEVIDPIRVNNPVSSRLILSEEDLKVAEAYDEDKHSVKSEERLEFLSKAFGERFDKDYKGVTKVEVPEIWQIEEELYIEGTDTYSITLKKDKSLQKVIAAHLDKDGGLPKKVREDLLKLYPSSKIDLYIEQKDDELLTIGSCPYTESVSIIKLEFGNPAEPLLEDLIEYEVGRRAFYDILSRVGGKSYVCTSEQADDVEIADLTTQFSDVMSRPAQVLFTNIPFEFQALNEEDLESLKDVVGRLQDTEAAIYSGWGVPESLINGGDQYSGDSIKLEIMNTEFLQLRERLGRFITDGFIKPISVKKGFLVGDDWGDFYYASPIFSFTRVSIRSETMMENLFNLYLKGSLPLTIILDSLSLDAEEVTKGIAEASGTVLDSQFNDMFSDVMGSITSEVPNKVRETLMKRMYASINIPVTSEDLPKGEEGY